MQNMACPQRQGLCCRSLVRSHTHKKIRALRSARISHEIPFCYEKNFVCTFCVCAKVHCKDMDNF